MASAPIRIRDEDKAKLEDLQAWMARASGSKPSQQEVIGRAVEFASRHRDEFLDEIGWKPPSKAEARRLLSLPEDLGSWTTRDIDDIVYGDGA